MARGWTETDPDKGKPHRHTRAKIRLMLADVHDDHLALANIILKAAEKRPDDVLDAVLAVLGDDHG